MNTRRPLGRILDRHLRFIATELPRAFEGDGEALHRARVTSRRAREVLPVAAAAFPTLDLAKARRRLRRITRTLGTVRELDVTLLILGAREKAGSLTATAAESARRQVTRQRTERRREMLDRIPIAKFQKLQRKVLAAIGVAEAHEPDAERRERIALAGRVAQRADRLRGAIDDAGAIYLPDRLHALRVAVKQLRYTLELVGETRFTSTAALVKRLKRAQNVLGELHDLEVVTGHLQGLDSADARRSAVKKDLAAGVRDAQADCRRLHARYVAAREILVDVCRASKEEVALSLVGRRRTFAGIRATLSAASRRAARAVHERRSA